VSETERKLRLAMGGEDYHQIRRSIDDLNQATMRLAELIMDAAVGGALRARTWTRRGWARAGSAASDC